LWSLATSNTTISEVAVHIFFPGGVRLTTWLTLIAFLVLAAWRADWRPFLAALAWLLGFEAAYQITCIITGNGSPASNVSAPMLIGIGVVSVAVATHYGVYPSWPIMGAVAVVWIAWVAAGLPASLPTRFNAEAEVFNETAKLLWAAAYMVPLLAPCGRGVSRRTAMPQSCGLPVEVRWPAVPFLNRYCSFLNTGPGPCLVSGAGVAAGARCADSRCRRDASTDAD
jgi:hypothetical protein